MNKIYCIRCRKKICLHKYLLSADMAWQSVRWLHLSLMLFICVGKSGRSQSILPFPFLKKELDPALIRYPFKALQVLPLNRKFSEDLTHRDYLGSILNLGIDRSKTGDILIENNTAILFAHDDIVSFLCSELTRIRHTSVKTEELPSFDIQYTPKYEELTGTVASVRLDSLLSLAFSSSRTKLSGLIEGGRVFVNGKLITSNGYQPNEGDLISVRKMGKFRFAGIGNKTRKHRIYVRIQKYI